MQQEVFMQRTGFYTGALYFLSLEGWLPGLKQVAHLQYMHESIAKIHIANLQISLNAAPAGLYR